MSFPRYPKHKDSGVEWLGKVPEHWEVKRLRFAAEINPSKREVASLDRETSVSFLPMEAIGDDGTLSLERQRAVEDLESGYTYFREGDVAIAKITPCFENGKGALMRGLTNGIGFGTTELIVLRPKPLQVIGAYLHYLFISPDFRSLGESHMYGAGGQKRVPEAFVQNFATALPPLAEQSQIAAFLDRETAKIDALVAEQRRLMELLKEKRQAVISHAVTKGLNPDAPMKPSGIDWLGEVPAHWEVKHLRRLVKPGTTITYGIVQAGPDIEGGIPYIRTSDMAGESLPEGGYMRTTPEIDASYARSKVKMNDLVVAIRASLGKGLLVPAQLDGANLTQGTARICPGVSLLPKFLAWSFNSEYCQTSIRVVAKGTTFLEITLDALRRIPLAVPPLPEQAEIVERLERDVTQINALTSEAQRAIDLLQERRTALISAAVTGRINVNPVGEVLLTVVAKPYSSGFARQLLAAEILHQCHQHPTMGRVKLQKLIHLCEHVAEIEEVSANYARQAAGPFDNKVMFGIATGLSKQKWFAEVKDGKRSKYQPLEKAGEHQKYLSRWEDKMPKIRKVLQLLGKAETQQCEIVSTLYAAWNDLLIEGRSPKDAEIIREASDPERWHEEKAKIPPEKWPIALKWMKEKGLIPKGFGNHTKRPG